MKKRKVAVGLSGGSPGLPGAPWGSLGLGTRGAHWNRFFLFLSFKFMLPKRRFFWGTLRADMHRFSTWKKRCGGSPNASLHGLCNKGPCGLRAPGSFVLFAHLFLFRRPKNSSFGENKVFTSLKRETSRGDEHVVAREALEGALSRSLGVRAHEPRPSSAEHVRELVAEVVRALAQIRKLVDVV